MTPIPLTLVTITKDDPAGLERTLLSAAKLRQEGAEHWVVDGTASLPPADAGVLTASGINVLRLPPRGVANAFNAGIAAARGEWVWCLNGGDQVDPLLTPEFLSALLADSRADVIVGGTTYEGESAPRSHPPTHLRWPPFRSWIPHPSTLVRRRLFEQFGSFDESYTIAMDYEWWLRAIPSGIAVDVVNLSFAIFAPGGLSQRPENLATVRREQRAALRKHQVALGRSWAALSGRWWKAWFLAQVARGARKSSSKP